MPQKLLIIQPSHYRSRTDPRLAKAHRRSLVPLTLPYLAALTPADWQVKLVDELVEDVPLDEPVDLAAITTQTVNSYRVYDLARQLRQRGARVILGGPHVFFHPEEAAEHCDAIGIGEGENIWQQMLGDAAAGRLQRIYRSETLPVLAGLPFPRYELLNLQPYSRFKTFAVQATRGCPFHCDFCAERLYLGTGFRHRPVAEVLEEIKHTGGKSVFFADSNFGGNPAQAMELMEALVPLKLRWSVLWSINLCSNEKFMDLAQRSGLLHLNLGMESIDPATIAGMGKKQNQVRHYGEILADLRRRGISYSLNFIFGWDNESKEIFPSTLQFLHEHKVPVAYFNVLTPEPGTVFYQRMARENRLLNLQEMGRYPGHACHFQPAYCTTRELEQWVQQLYRDFYTFPSMLKRLPFPTTLAGVASWVLNFSQRKLAHQTQPQLEFERY